MIIPCIAVFLYTHFGESGEQWASYYKSFVPANLGVPRNAWDYRITAMATNAERYPGGEATTEIGWMMFWREAWVSFGVLWIFALLAWRRSPWLWRVMFLVLWLGCFVACMVSHDKMRLWYRMAPAIIPMVVMWIAWLETRGFHSDIAPFFNWSRYAREYKKAVDKHREREGGIAAQKKLKEMIESDDFDDPQGFYKPKPECTHRDEHGRLTGEKLPMYVNRIKCTQCGAGVDIDMDGRITKVEEEAGD